MSKLKDLSPKEFENHLESQVFETVRKNQELFKKISDQSSSGTPDSQLLTEYKKSEDRLVFFLHARKEFSENFQTEPLLAYKSTVDLCIETLGKSSEPLNKNLDLLEVLNSAVDQIFEAHGVIAPEVAVQSPIQIEDFQAAVRHEFEVIEQDTEDSDSVIQELVDQLDKTSPLDAEFTIDEIEADQDIQIMSELDINAPAEDSDYVFIEDTNEEAEANSESVIKELVGDIDEVHVIETHLHDHLDVSQYDDSEANDVIDEILASREHVAIDDNADSLLSYESQFDANNEAVEAEKWSYNSEELVEDTELESIDDFFNSSFTVEAGSETSEIEVQDSFDSDSAFGK